MGTHAERVAISNKVSRQDQDEFALRSHQRAVAAIDEGRFEAEIAPVTVRDAKGRETIVAVDEGPRRDSTIEALARLKPAFDLPDGRGPRRRDRWHGHGRQRPGHHGRRSGDRRRERADGRAIRPQAARQDHRLRPGRGGAEVAVPRPGPGRPPAPRSDRDADRGVRPDRDQRGVRGPDAGRRGRARLRLGQGERQRRGDRPGSPDRGIGARIVATLLHELERRQGHTGSQPSVSVAAGRWRWPSSASDGPLPTNRDGSVARLERDVVGPPHRAIDGAPRSPDPRGPARARHREPRGSRRSRSPARRLRSPATGG